MRVIAALLASGFVALAIGSAIGSEWLMAIGCAAMFLGIVGVGAA